MGAGFGAMSVLLLVGGLVTVSYTYRMQSATSELLAHSVMCLKAAESVEGAADDLRVMTTDDVLTNAALAAVLDQHRSEFRGLLHEAEGTARAAAQTDVIEAVEATFAEYEWSLQNAREFAAAGHDREARELLRQSQALGDEMVASIDQFDNINERLMYADLDRIVESNRTVRWAMYALGAAGILLGWVLFLVISRSITKPICQLVLKARGATGYELVERVDVRRGTELEELEEQIRALVERINVARSELEASHHLLQRSERLAALGRVSAGIAHEIRNPLTSIKMLIFALQEDAALDDEEKKDLAVIVSRSTAWTVSSTTSCASPPAGSGAVATDLNQIVRETLEVLSPHLERSRVTLVTSDQPGTGRAQLDPDQIRRVLMNLVLNALDAMPAGGSLSIDTRRMITGSDEPGWLQIEVRDTGCGIPAELVETLFDPFVSGRKGGTGLGLAISHQIVQQHGGWIDFANDPAGGSIFTVNLPDRQGQEHAQSAGSGRRRERPLLVPKNAA
jgi:signal transduction histidine kinase